jgi:hypothetical protein
MRHSLEQLVAFHDIDYFHHANNAAYSTWTETARLAYMRDVCGVLDLSEMKIVLGSLSIRFLSPARYGERVSVSTEAIWLGKKSFSSTTSSGARTGERWPRPRPSRSASITRAGRASSCPRSGGGAWRNSKDARSIASSRCLEA